MYHEVAIKDDVRVNLLGRYERGEASPSVEVAAKLADVLGVSLDYLVGKSAVDIDQGLLILTRINEIASMPEEEQRQLFSVVDALIRDYKAKK